jgi:hypothetical protein
LRSLAKLWEIECVDYPSNKSFVKAGAFIQVWNVGTLEWNSIAGKYQEFNLPSLRDKATQFPMSDRGNRSLSVGFTGQSHQRDRKTCVQKPVLCANTKHWGQEMANLSHLLKVCGGAPPESDYSHRRKVDFAELIQGDNILEGFTPCITNVSTQEVHCHLDRHNDQSAEGFGVVIVASEIKNGERYAGVGYYKNPCGAYYRRLTFTNKAIHSASHLLESLDPRRQMVSKAHFPDLRELAIPGFSHRSVCMDKAAHYSPFVHVFRLLVQTHGLSFSRALECLLPVGWEGVTPESYWEALSFWIESEQLPTENLALAFLKRTAALGVSVTYSQIEPSLRYMRVVMDDVNSSSVLHRHKLHSLVLLLVKYVPGTTKTSCQRLASVAALAGLLRHPALAAQACHSPKQATNLTNGIRESFGCSTVNQASEVIHAVASALDISRAVSESIFSEMLLESSNSSLDCYFPGQTFFKVVDGRVLQLFPDGRRVYLEPMVLSEEDYSPIAQPWRAGPCPIILSQDNYSPSPGSAGPCPTNKSKRGEKRKAMICLPSRPFTRSATRIFPSKLAISESATPWASVNLQERAMRIVGLSGRRSFGRENIQYMEEVTSTGGNEWRAICHVNGSTWDPRSSPSSCSFGGVPHKSRYTKEGNLCHTNKKAALDHLLLYLCLYCDESSFSWERNTLDHHHFVCLRKEHTIAKDEEPFMVLFVRKGRICIGHYKDNWRTTSVLCYV